MPTCIPIWWHPYWSWFVIYLLAFYSCYQGLKVVLAESHKYWRSDMVAMNNVFMPDDPNATISKLFLLGSQQSDDPTRSSKVSSISNLHRAHFFLPLLQWPHPLFIIGSMAVGLATAAPHVGHRPPVEGRTNGHCRPMRLPFSWVWVGPLVVFVDGAK